jgi:ABC-type multidrug transport system ATPase subunit
VTGLVGPNGAGKSTLLHLATGLLAPTTGTIEVAGGRPAASAAQLARVGFVAQDAPTYAGLSVGDHLRLGAHLNPAWDAQLARGRIRRLGLDPAQKAGKLSGGQRAQLALTLAIAKRPELLILDEPVASLDPLARRDFLQDLRQTVAEQHVSVVLSSHLVADIERVCDYLIVPSPGSASGGSATAACPDLAAERGLRPAPAAGVPGHRAGCWESCGRWRSPGSARRATAWPGRPPPRTARRARAGNRRSP